MTEVTPDVRAAQAHEKHFSKAAERIFKAPGRVNIIGEHTDYNDGFVLPAALNYFTAIAASKREDRVIVAIALDEKGSRVKFSLDEPVTRDADAPWSNYLRGVVIELLGAGYQLCGANIVIAGNVPLGAGLSSSAALEIVSAAALTGLSDEAISGVQAALFGQAAENNFCGCSCGVMDQLASALCEPQKAMLLDCRSLQAHMVDLPAELSLVIINSNVKRGLVDSEYNIRRQQCETAASYFGVDALRDLSLEQLVANKAQIDILPYKRAYHVITENRRTLDAADALSRGDITALSKLMVESHESMRDDFEITVPEIDILVDIINQTLKGRGAARMTGGGFGGCVVALVPRELENSVIQSVNEQYFSNTGLQPEIHICQAAGGAFATLAEG